MKGENIQLHKVTKRFKDNVVLDKLDGEFAFGKITCIMGPSGTGKTTLLNLMMKLIKPEEGTITGLEQVHMSAVFQEDRLCKEFDAITNVMMVQPHIIPKEQIKKEFEAVELTDYENKPVNQLSGGMKRRVAIVRALLTPSDVIFMDEPLKGLDEKLKQKVIQYIKEKTKGKTVIIVTHDSQDVKEFNSDIFRLPKHGNSVTMSDK